MKKFLFLIVALAMCGSAKAQGFGFSIGHGGFHGGFSHGFGFSGGPVYGGRSFYGGGYGAPYGGFYGSSVATYGIPGVSTYINPGVTTYGTVGVPGVSTYGGTYVNSGVTTYGAIPQVYPYGSITPPPVYRYQYQIFP